MADPKQEPQWETHLRKINAWRKSADLRVEKEKYAHPRTNRTMIRFKLMSGSDETPILETKDYNLTGQVLAVVANMVERGVL